VKRVRVFVDHANFDIGWKESVGRGTRLNWEILPDMIINKLQEMRYLKGNALEMSGVYVYASTHPRPSDADLKYEHWLKFILDQLPGYTVKHSLRQARVSKCEQGHKFTHYVEKGVDTRIACDMLAAAIRGAYDIAVVISDDADLLPSVEVVQDVLDRHVVHVGFKKSGEHLRSAAWGHILLDGLVDELKDRRLKAVS